MNVVPAARAAQAGTALALALLMLVAIVVLGLSGMRISLLSEKASRNDRDRQIALHAAEAALLDAELDIRGAPASSNGRGRIFMPGVREGFPDRGCASGAGNRYLGLCATPEPGEQPVWQVVDFQDHTENAASVPYGWFTGQIFPAGGGSLPVHPPRYIIELLPAGPDHGPPDTATSLYRITAIGFGMGASTRVVLQSYYRKNAPQSADAVHGDRRIAWREIINWNELRNESQDDA